jgi:hypothetical protein
MVKALSVLAAVISIGVAAAIESEFWPIDDSTKAAHGLINGMILGSNLWYSNPSRLSVYKLDADNVAAGSCPGSFPQRGKRGLNRHAHGCFGG